MATYGEKVGYGPQRALPAAGGELCPAVLCYIFIFIFGAKK